MATTAKTKAARAESRAVSSRQRSANRSSDQGIDAIDLLVADHREVDGYFETYETLESDAEKRALAAQICLALKVHTQIEEEILYPAARKATGDSDLIDEAVVEHMGAKSLIAQIEAMVPGQPLYDAKIKVLGEQVRHHVEEEENELFPELRASKADLQALGARLAARKEELTALLSAPRAAA